MIVKGIFRNLTRGPISFKQNIGSNTIPVWVTNPVNNMIAEIGDSRTVISDTSSASTIKRKNATARNWAAFFNGQKFTRSSGSYGTGGATVSQIVNGTGSVPVSMDSRMKADSSAIWRFPAGINSVTLSGATLTSIQAEFRQAANVAFTNQKILVVGFITANTTGIAAITSDQQTLAYQVNNWLKTGLTSEFSHVFYSPVFEATAKNTGIPSDAKDNFLYDGKHLLSAAAALSADVEDQVYKSLLKYTDQSPSVFDTQASPNRLSNISFSGTGTTLPTNTSNTLPSGISAAYSYPTGGGVQVVLTGTPTSSGFYTLDQAIASGNIYAGDILQFGVDVTITQGSTGIVAVAGDLNLIDGTPTVFDFIDMDSNGAILNSVPNLLDSVFSTKSRTGRLLTAPSFVTAAGTSYTTRRTRIYVYLLANNPINATLVFQNPRLAKIN